jgi:hypothetical protein
MVWVYYQKRKVGEIKFFFSLRTETPLPTLIPSSMCHQTGTQVMDCSGKTCSKPTASSKTVSIIYMLLFMLPTGVSLVLALGG